MSKSTIAATLLLSLSLLSPCAVFAVEQRSVNDGNLVMQDVPKIPTEIAEDLLRYQNVRSAGFLDWNQQGTSLYVRTRFGDVSQIHEISEAGGSRSQRTFFKEPVGRVNRQSKGNQLAFTMDAGGSEFAQIFLLNSATGESKMLTDGESRNGGVAWDNAGVNIAYQSTKRNGASNDIWMMDVEHPESAQMIFASPDGTYWVPSEFDAKNEKVLIRNYVSIVDSRIHLLDLNTGAVTQVMGLGGPALGNKSSNSSATFDKDEQGIFFVTDAAGEFTQLAWAPLAQPLKVTFITDNIKWDVEGITLSDDKSRGAFVVNAGGINELYLLDTAVSYTHLTLPTIYSV